MSALVLKHLTPSLPLALAIVLLSRTVVGLVGGVIAIRTKGVYFALISFGLPFLGFDPWRHKLAVFVLAAQVAAVSGALYPMLRGFVSPELMFFQVSGNVVINVIVGGTGTLVGALYGSALLTVLKKGAT